MLDFFRKDSALLTVFLLVSLVVAGNLNSKKENSGFLFGYFEEENDTQEKIQHRVKSHVSKNNLAITPLTISGSSSVEEDFQALQVEDVDLKENQMQYQVLTAIKSPGAKILLDEGADVAVYEVKPGDTVSTIANDFKITSNTILWANDIDDPDMIQPGDKIFILPTTGVKHKIKPGENIDSIAKKYEADKEKIISFNMLPADGRLKEGEEIIIPEGKIEAPPTLKQREYYSSGVADSGERTPSIIDRNPKGGHNFPYGYCTWYVAQHKYVPWGGNAGTWLYHAKSYGVKTGKNPKKGAILVTNESWYGHVAIVTKVNGDQITVKEMNYKGFAVESTRTLSTKSRVIKGYIY
jgi:surface antigen/LysM repeat protein